MGKKKKNRPEWWTLTVVTWNKEIHQPISDCLLGGRENHLLMVKFVQEILDLLCSGREILHGVKKKLFLNKEWTPLKEIASHKLL